MDDDKKTDYTAKKILAWKIHPFIQNIRAVKHDYAMNIYAAFSKVG